MPGQFGRRAMHRRSTSLTVACLLCVGTHLQAQETQESLPPGPGRPTNSAIILQDPFGEIKAEDQDESGKSGSNKPFEKKHIRDNAFLVEEAYNQEKGVVQHIFNWVNLWDRTNESRTRDFLATYTMELPLGSQTHQFSFTTQCVT